MSATLDRWIATVHAHERIPPGPGRAREELPDAAVLEQAGFELTASRGFPAVHAWTAESLTGFVYSTSFLPRVVLGDLAGRFEEDLLGELYACDPGGVYQQTIRFACQIARRPGRPAARRA